MKAMDKEGSGFAFLQKFLQISMDKLKAVIFDGPQIKEFMKDPMFGEALSETELAVTEVSCYKLPWKPAECRIQEEN